MTSQNVTQVTREKSEIFVLQDITAPEPVPIGQGLEGTVLIFRADLIDISDSNSAMSSGNLLVVGVDPVAVAFALDGRTIVTANSGEPRDNYSVDPEGRSKELMAYYVISTHK